jgi:hypothetical protein
MIYSLQIEANETGTSPALALPQWPKTLSVGSIFVGGRKRNYRPQADMQARISRYSIFAIPGRSSG